MKTTNNDCKCNVAKNYPSGQKVEILINNEDTCLFDFEIKNSKHEPQKWENKAANLLLYKIASLYEEKTDYDLESKTNLPLSACEWCCSDTDDVCYFVLPGEGRVNEFIAHEGVKSLVDAYNILVNDRIIRVKAQV